MAPTVRACLAQGVTCAIFIKVVVDVIVTLLDAALDIFISYKFFKWVESTDL